MLSSFTFVIRDLTPLNNIDFPVAKKQEKRNTHSRFSRSWTRSLSLCFPSHLHLRPHLHESSLMRSAPSSLHAWRGHIFGFIFNKSSSSHPHASSGSALLLRASPQLCVFVILHLVKNLHIHRLCATFTSQGLFLLFSDYVHLLLLRLA